MRRSPLGARGPRLWGRPSGPRGRTWLSRVLGSKGGGGVEWRGGFGKRRLEDDRAYIPFSASSSPRARAPIVLISSSIHPPCPPYVFFSIVPSTLGSSDPSFIVRRSLGRPGQPQAVHAGAHRQARVRQAQVGARVQGLFGQHGRLHESSGASRARSALALVSGR